MKLGFVCMPLSGHLNPMTSLARKLQSRGHEVAFISVLDAGPMVRAANLNFVPFCEEEYPRGSMAKPWSDFSRLQGMDVLRYWFQDFLPGLSEAGLKHLPEIVENMGIEALAFDSTYRNLELVPMRIGMPYAQIWNVLPFDSTGATPPLFLDWPYDPTPEGRAKNIVAMQAIKDLFTQAQLIASSYAEKMGMLIDWTNPAALTLKRVILSQIPREFDFPGIDWPSQFHYTGPFHDDAGRAQVPFAWEKLTGAPLIYASLGTLVNGLEHVYRTILEAAGKLHGVQVVLSIGRHVNPDHLGPIPSNTMVVSQAPQIELLRRADLCITHAGLNTTIESLANGIPMVAIPIAFDQPGIAARIAHHGVGEFLNLDNLNTERLATLIQNVLKNAGYKNKAVHFQKVIAEARGLDTAADLLENAFAQR